MVMTRLFVRLPVSVSFHAVSFQIFYRFRRSLDHFTNRAHSLPCSSDNCIHTVHTYTPPLSLCHTDVILYAAASLLSLLITSSHHHILNCSCPLSWWHACFAFLCIFWPSMSLCDQPFCEPPCQVMLYLSPQGLNAIANTNPTVSCLEGSFLKSFVPCGTCVFMWPHGFCDLTTLELRLCFSSLHHYKP